MKINNTWSSERASCLLIHIKHIVLLIAQQDAENGEFLHLYVARHAVQLLGQDREEDQQKDDTTGREH